MCCWLLNEALLAITHLWQACSFHYGPFFLLLIKSSPVSEVSDQRKSKLRRTNTKAFSTMLSIHMLHNLLGDNSLLTATSNVLRLSLQSASIHTCGFPSWMSHRLSISNILTSPLQLRLLGFINDFWGPAYRKKQALLHAV